MRRFAIVLFILGAWLGSHGAEFRLTNGDVLTGEASSFTDDGLVVRLEVGGFSDRIPWGKVSQESLKLLMELPQAMPFVEPYLDVPVELKQREKERAREINVREPERVALASGQPSLFALLTSPVGLFIAAVLYLANLYAGMEVARFRHRPPGLVLAVSALVPVLGPVLFAALPTAGAVHEGPAEAPADATVANPLAKGGSAGGLSVAGQTPSASSAANPAYAQVYNRSNTTFDRRFIETKFTGFFRVVPADAEKDLVLVVKTPKAEYVAKRISRISMAEMHLQLQRGSEVSVPFGEITEVLVRHKDAK